MNKNIKKGLVLLPSLIIIGIVFFYYLTNPLIANDLTTLTLTIPAILGLIYLTKPTNAIKYLTYSSILLVSLFSFFVHGSLDALGILLFTLILMGISL